jgi:hypothetical protein
MSEMVLWEGSSTPTAAPPINPMTDPRWKSLAAADVAEAEGLGAAA